MSAPEIKPENNREKQPHGGELKRDAGPGAPRGPRLKTIISEMLDAGLTPQIQKKLAKKLGIPIERLDQAMIATQIITSLRGGNVGVRAAEFLRDTLEGRPTQRIGGPDGGAIPVVFASEDEINERLKKFIEADRKREDPS